MTRATLAAVAFALAGCVTTPAVNPGIKIRPETRTECATHCKALGMRLGAVVLVRNSEGCVCVEPDAQPGASAGGGAAANAGAYLVALEEEEERRRREEEQDADRRRQDERKDDERRRQEEDQRRRDAHRSQTSGGYSPTGSPGHR